MSKDAPRGPSRREVVVAGHLGGHDVVVGGLASSDPAVRAAALGALARLGLLGPADLDDALRRPAEPDGRVRAERRRAIELSANVPPSDAVDGALLAILTGPDAALAETAAWALGERHAPPDEPSDHRAIVPQAIISALASTATDHADALCREAAVAALGSLGDRRALPAILAATSDKATVRRRAVLALAPFDGDDVHAALLRARTDRDWQVRQAAEDLLRA